MKLINNDLVMGSSGRIGEQLVYRQRGGKTIIAKRPKAKTTPDTASQLAARELFSEAVLYAKTVVTDPAKKAIYQVKTKAHQSAYNLALSDFCKAPEIKICDSSAYTGEIGQQIRIRATDDFKVESVQVVIKDSNGVTLEEGATVLAANGVDWIYTATAGNPNLAGSMLLVSASDIPGNITTEEILL